MEFLRCRALLWGLWLAVLAGSGIQAAEISKEYLLKAVFLYNFARYTYWPAEAFADKEAPLVIGVLGENPFGAALEQAVRGEKLEGRSLVVRYFTKAEEVVQAHVLFIASGAEKDLAQVLATLGKRSVLTVGEGAGFTRQGGIVGFYEEEGKVRYEISVQAAERVRLQISSKLLKLARIVSGEVKK